MGWLVVASSPQRFAWLMEAPRTQSGPSALSAQVARIDAIAGYLPRAWQPWLQLYQGHGATVRVEVDAGVLTLTAALVAPP